VEWACVLLVVLLGLRFYVGFLPDVGEAGDGFQSQILYIGSVLREGELLEATAENPLILVHLGRLAAVSVFLAVESVVGPSASLFLLLILLLPLVALCRRSVHRFVALLPLGLPLFISGRSVLVAAGVGYLLLFALSARGRKGMLWIGTLFANLSSASVLASILLLSFVRPDGRQSTSSLVQRALALAALAVSFGVSALDKSAGFKSGDVGYEAQPTFDSDNLFLIVLGRSTVIISLADGQYARAIVYLAIETFLLMKIVLLLRDSRMSLERRVLFCCLPGIFLEGLGVLAMFFPLVWLLLGVSFTAHLGRQQVGAPAAPPTRRRRPPHPISPPAGVL
jgi:hypothetical protein